MKIYLYINVMSEPVSCGFCALLTRGLRKIIDHYDDYYGDNNKIIIIIILIYDHKQLLPCRILFLKGRNFCFLSKV